MADTNQAPYFDDYDSSKNYHQILFKPGRAVQAREFNQLQTILQEQIKRFGNHVFENGAMVIPGESNYNLNYEYVTMNNVDYSDISEILETNSVIVTGQTSGVVAEVMQYQPNVGTDPITFYLQYLNGSEDGSVSRFQTGETLILTTGNGITFATPTCIGTGVGSAFTMNAGVFFVNGYFVESQEQSIILSRYSSNPSSVVGFRLRESFIDWTEDQTLLDNANGSINFNGIGADRLKLSLSLEAYELGSDYDQDNFIELAIFREGVLQKLVRTTEYSVLEDTLARRTYDQAGDYTVESFGLSVREHLNDGSNNGLYVSGDESKFVLGVEPGKAYVRGYEISNIATRYLEVDKAREVGSVDNSSFTLPLGAFVEATTGNTSPRIGSTVKFYSGTPSTPGAIPSGSVLGYGYLISVERDPSGLMRLYLARIRKADESADTSFINASASVYIEGSPAFSSLVNPVLQDPSNYGLLYKLPINNAKTLLSESGVSDTSLVVNRQIVANADTSGTVILTAGTNEVFVTPNGSNSFASFGSTVREIGTISTIGGSPSGKTLTIAFGSAAASSSVTVTVQVVKQTSTHKSKTLANSSVTVAFTDVKEGNRFYLNKADVVKVVSIKTPSNQDVTSKYRLERNAHPDFYGISFISPNAGETLPSTNLIIDFQYFVHGTSGDYFSADSYTVPYEDIPMELVDGVYTRASDFFDFRPRKPDNNNNDFVGAGFNSVEVPSPYSLIRADVQFYLPRIDKVFVNSKGVFGTVKGVPALDPKEPKTPDNSMLLYRVYIPAYTLNIKEIVLEFVNNRRYTMRDIGGLETRIANLEYYTTLSLLETETSGMQITDAQTGLNRFKNGFVVDSFIDHSVGLFSSPNYKCSISPTEETLRPEFYADQVDMKFKASGSTTVLTGSLVTLPFTEVNFLSQEYASNFLNVNPYAVYRWNGDIKLTPNNDTWFDSVYTDPQVTYEVYNNGRLTQTWDSWGLNWVGGTVTSNLYKLGGSSKWSSNENISNNAHGTVGKKQTTTTTTNITVVDDKVVSSEVIPFMRSKEVVFSAIGLKPLSRMYPFFDNVDVSAYCKQEGKAFGAALVTDDQGAIAGVFNIPNDDTLKFRTGKKQFTLNDNLLNVKETSLAYADEYFTSKGLLETRTQSIVATQSISVKTKPWDPLAQSFFVEKDGGVFVTSVELYFASKDAAANVTIQIRNMDNGSPGQLVVPYSTKTLRPSEVNISDNATVATKFVFDSPVYLTDGNEYCYVVMSNSNNYNVFIATMGNRVIDTTDYISKQPFVGVLFKSQNNTTWTADQESDMKFRINIAKFQTNTAYKADFVNDKTVPMKLFNNPLISTSGSNIITAQVPDHNLFVGSKVVISGVDVGPGIPLEQLNKQQIVTAVLDADHYQFETTTNANTSGTFGGGVVNSERNMILNTVHPIFQELLFENTNVNWTMSGVTGKSLDGTETPYEVIQPDAIVPNQNTNVPVPIMIPSVSESTMVNDDFMHIAASMISFSDNVSPVIDINRSGVIGVVNRINNPVVLDETAPEGGNAIARYITNIIGLKNPANSLKVYLDLNKPQGSNVIVYFRTGNSEEELNTKNWTTLPTIISVTSSDTENFSEAEFGMDNIADFGYYQYKIVMVSNSSSVVPRCKRLRGIALGT